MSIYNIPSYAASALRSGWSTFTSYLPSVSRGSSPLADRVITPAPTEETVSRIETAAAPVILPPQETLRTTPIIPIDPSVPVESASDPSTPKKPIATKETTDQAVKVFIEKASMLATISLLDSSISFEDQIKILDQAHQNKTSSLLQVFLKSQGHRLSFFGKAKVYLRYFIGYKCGLISNLVETFTKSVVGQLRDNLARQDNKNLETTSKIILKKASTFLGAYQQSLIDFAQNKTISDRDGQHIVGDRDDFIAGALTHLTGKKDIKDICSYFSEILISEFLPNIPIFIGWKKHSFFPLRLLGKICIPPIEFLFNRHLRKMMHKEIPAQIESLITISVAKTKKDNYVFAEAITRAIVEQLQEIQKDSKSPPIQSPFFADEDRQIEFETLPTVIRTLIQVLKLEPYKERTALLSKLQEPETPPFLSAPIDHFVKPRLSSPIEATAIDGCRTIFTYFSDHNHAEELFTKLFSLTNSLFEPSPHDSKYYENEFKNQKAKMEKIANDFFTCMVEKAVRQDFQGFDEDQILALGNQMTEEVQQSFSASLTDLAKQFKEVQNHTLDCSNQIVDFETKLIEIQAAYKQKRQMLLDLREDRLPPSLKPSIDLTYQTALKHIDALIKTIKTLKTTDSSLATNKATAKLLKTIQRSVSNVDVTPETLEALTKHFVQAQPTLVSLPAVTMIRFEASLKQLAAMGKTKGSEQRNEIILEQLQKELSAFERLPAETHIVKRQDALSKMKIECKTLEQTLPEDARALWDLLNQAQNQLARKLDPSEQIRELNTRLAELKHTHHEAILTISRQFEETRTDLFKSLRDEICLSFDPRLDHLETAFESSSDEIQSELTQFQSLSKTLRIEKTNSRINRGIEMLGGKSPIIGTAGIVSTLAFAFASMPLLAVPSSIVGVGGVLKSRYVQKKASSYISNNHAVPEVLKTFNNFYSFVLQQHVWKTLVLQSVMSINEAYQPPKTP